MDHNAIVEATRTGISQSSTRWIGPPGKQRAFSFVAQPVLAEDGTVLGGIVVGNDITALLNAIRVRDRFLDTIGHELRTPLTTILGRAGLLADDPRTRVAGEQMEKSALRLKSVVDQLLFSARNDVTPGKASSAVHEALVELDGSLRAAAEERNIDFWIIDDGCGHVWFDARELAQTLSALVSNALNVTPPGGSIVIHAYPDSRTTKVKIDVTDSGVGMTPDEIHQAFDRFYRTDYAIGQALPGTGLGLTIARNRAYSNRATITLVSNPGRGTVASLAAFPGLDRGNGGG